jgi:hypothetical protein
MSIFSKVARVVGKSLKSVSKVPGVKTVARAVPFVGTAMAVYEGAQLVNDLTGGALTGGSGGSAPASAANLPMLPGSAAVPMGTTSGPGLLPRGPGGSLQMPWNDPNIPEYLKQFSIDDGYLRTAVRAPRGYVVLRDNEGRPFGVNKKIAQALRVWKPKKKPPISVTDWESLKRANRTVKKLKRVVKMSKVVSMPSRRTTKPAKACA